MDSEQTKAVPPAVTGAAAYASTLLDDALAQFSAAEDAVRRLVVELDKAVGPNLDPPAEHIDVNAADEPDFGSSVPVRAVAWMIAEWGWEYVRSLRPLLPFTEMGLASHIAEVDRSLGEHEHDGVAGYLIQVGYWDPFIAEEVGALLGQESWIVEEMRAATESSA